MATPVLSLRDLNVTFPTPAGPARAVRGLDLDVFAGESVAVVGESGSGKSVTMLAALGLLPKAQVSGSVKYGISSEAPTLLCATPFTPLRPGT